MANLALKNVHALKPNPEAKVDTARPSLVAQVGRNGLRTWIYRYREDSVLRADHAHSGFAQQCICGTALRTKRENGSTSHSGSTADPRTPETAF
jgi:hypothetical protein